MREELITLVKLSGFLMLIAAAALLGQLLRGNTPPMSDNPYLTKLQGQTGE